MSLKEASEKFVELLKTQKRASATILAYGSDVVQLARFAESKGVSVITAVNDNIINEFKEYLFQNNYTAKSVSRKINSIKTFFRFLKDARYLETDPSVNIVHPKYEIKPPRILSKIEYRALRDSCRGDVRVSAIIELMLQTGIRIGELANLSMQDYKDKEIFIKAYESHSERTIPLNKAAKEALERYLAERPKVKEKKIFITKTGRPFLIRNVRSSLERYFESAGIKDAKVNDLRHTWIFHHLATGTPLTTISQLAGHKRLSTTERYLKLVTDPNSNPLRLEEL